QRERVDSRIAGVRTFPLMTLFGALTALLAQALDAWAVVAAGLLALTAMLIIANLAKLKLEADPGLTTEMAALLMYAVGAYVVVGHAEAAIFVGGAVLLLLHLKGPMHRFVAAMGERDLSAIMQFALITLVILPVLPNRTYGPYDVLNPFKVWLMVVLIVAVSLGGYVAYKVIGARAGTLLAGVVGGLVSSTATTLSFARRTHAGSEQADAPAIALAAQVIVVASTVALPRLIVAIAIVAPAQALAMAGPLGALFAWMLALSALAWLRGRHEADGELPEVDNPAELKPALIFGALFALITLAVAFVKQRFGDAGLYPVAVISGLTDMDAIALSTANLAAGGRLAVATAGELILVAELSNLAFKAGSAMVVGAAALRTRIAFYFGLAIAGGAAILLFWPW
ncbi:MAG TPA: MgtC/SapB family protein, partial [Burkholderiaceae bacterium]